MKKLLLKTLFYLLVIAITAFVFEKLFTYTHYHNAPRSSEDWVMSLDSTDTFDYVLLGSSRVLNNIDPKIIEEKTGKKGINLGVYGGQAFDIKLFAERLINLKNTAHLYIQVDDSWNNDREGKTSSFNWLPFIEEDFVWEQFNALENEQYWYYKHIPFYKYASFDSEIGIRDFIKGITNQKLKSIADSGFISLEEEIPSEEASKTYPFKLKDTMNLQINHILRMCTENNVPVTFFTAPIFNAEGDHSILNKYLPNYHDFTNTYSNPDYFKDRRHLNATGAFHFSEKIADIINQQ
ncbi:hypothetical protein [Ulvibacter litoralis]|uniref:SGNH/GDSL hydrolase family protein n=1 Tax=Ulvibacter litoralis TaxID=227084 RepID=A0A1G7FD14_9FLAO|nr:hypothetical protein [Ulvibacter litoralis]GHC51658.1 hypothetical protein GCM10008083_14190 [Ulvibacter litoralis]SDE73819.1 hypothetical protein SAMN05421855_102485 [Ulvibacter litoralis]